MMDPQGDARFTGQDIGLHIELQRQQREPGRPSQQQEAMDGSKRKFFAGNPSSHGSSSICQPELILDRAVSFHDSEEPPAGRLTQLARIESTIEELKVAAYEFGAIGNPFRSADAYSLMGSFFLKIGQFDRALEPLHRAQALYEHCRLGVADARSELNITLNCAKSVVRLIATCQQLGAIADVRDRADRTVKILDDLPNIAPLLSSSLEEYGLIRHRLRHSYSQLLRDAGEYHSALASLRERDTDNSASNDRLGRVSELILEAELIFLTSGPRDPSAISNLRGLLSILDCESAAEYVAIYLQSIAPFINQAGLADDGLRLVRQAAAVLEKFGNTLQKASIKRCEAAIRSGQGDHKGSAESLIEAMLILIENPERTPGFTNRVESFVHSKHPCDLATRVIARTLSDLSKELVRSGDRESGKAVLDSADAIAVRIADFPILSKLTEARALIICANGDRLEGERILDLAIGRAQALGAKKIAQGLGAFKEKLP